MSRGRGSYNWFNSGFPMVHDNTNAESLVPMFPIVFYDDFLGADILFPASGLKECGCKWHTLIVGTGPAVAKVGDGINGIASVAITNADESQVAVLSWGDQESLSLERGLIFEARVCFSILPTTGTETVQAVFGLAGAYVTPLDNVDCNAWFRVESAANTVLLWETDNNVAGGDDDANPCAGITLAINDYHIYRIDATNIAAVKFYVDGVLVGTGNMFGILATVGDVQPYFNVSKIKVTNNTGTGTMLVDYVRVFQDRS